MPFTIDRLKQLSGLRELQPNFTYLQIQSSENQSILHSHDRASGRTPMLIGIPDLAELYFFCNAVSPPE